MTLLRKLIRINETATSFICRRNIDYMIDVHIVGKVEGPGSVPIPDVGVFVLKTDQIPRDGSPQPLPFVGESRSDGSLDIKFKFMWGNKIGWRHKKNRLDTTFSLHFVHDDFNIEVVPVAYRGTTAQVVSQTNIILERLSEDEAQKVKRRGSRSQYLRKRDPEPGDPGESWDPDKPWPHEAPFGGDTFSIEGNCGDQTQRIVDGVRWAYWQLRNGNIVTDPGLRVCIMQHMNNASLGCGGGGCDEAVNGYNDDYLFFRSSHIVMCMGKVRNLSTTDIGRLAIHEWAHSCGWDHGDGKGVPGDSGVGLAEAVRNPALSVNTLFVAWKGTGEDVRLFFNSSTDGENFTEQRVIPGTGGTSQGPALAVFGNKLFVAWKGTGEDVRLFFNSSTDGENFTEQRVIPGTGGTSQGPALAVFGNKLFVAWKGTGEDVRLFFNSSTDGENFTEQRVIPGTGGTSQGPALAVFGNKLFVAWKGTGEDVRLFFNSSTDGENFTEQRVIPGTGGTSQGPALAVFGNKLFVAWKGTGEDVRLFFNSSTDGENFTEQRVIPGTGGTSQGPALAVFGNKLFVAWKGTGEDVRLFFNSSTDGENFTEQRVIPGTGGTSQGPALAMRPAIL